MQASSSSRFSRLLVDVGRATLTAAACVMVAGCSTAGLDQPITTGTIAPQPAEQAVGLVRKEEKVIRIALLLPLGAAGQTSLIAKGMKQAGEMALFDQNDAQFQLIAIDDKGTPEGAHAAAEQAKAEGADLILGPLFAASVGPAADVARLANIPVIAFTNDRQVAGRGVYLVSYLPDDEVDRIVTYAVSQGKKRFAALIPDDAFGAAVEAAFKAAVARNGGQIAGLERYALQANGMLEPVRRLAERMRFADGEGDPVDALFLPGAGETLINLGPLFAYANLPMANVKVLGTNGMDHPGLGKDKFYHGAWFAGADPKSWQDFSARFAKTFGSAPPRIATLSYDAVTIGATLAREPMATRYTAANLTRTGGFPAVDGTLRLTAAGLPTRGLAVLEVQDLGVMMIDQAAAPAVGTRQSAVRPNPAGQVN
jgi:ABC-type branched-subunit amino acid transport system substrate-binding protein